MLSILVLALPMGVGWMILSNQFALDSFVVGYVISLPILLIVGANRAPIKVTRAPSMLFWLIVYALYLAGDIFLSGVDVARRVLTPSLPINPGIVPVSTQDETQSMFISGLSAHGITITPGEMVVDFEGKNDSVMYVHALDVDVSKPKLATDQEKRLKMIKRMLGRD